MNHFPLLTLFPPNYFYSYMDMDMNNVHNCFSFDIHPINLPSAAINSNHNPKKKRTKFLRIAPSGDSDTPTPKPSRRPDPTAPKITRPCTECGKKFWSWKALFGHMRCHPERQWRGINPPPNFQPPVETASCSGTAGENASVTEEDREVAACLLILANCPNEFPSACMVNQGILPEYSNFGKDAEANAVDGAGHPGCRFECSSCRKVFGSHQALGGHRASHKNVKGCYANTKKDGEEGYCMGSEVSLGHKCSVCLRVFSSGQALGGHKRCHWEKIEEMASVSVLGSRVCGLDLNFPAAPLVEDEDDDSLSYSLGLPGLDLRLGL